MPVSYLSMIHTSVGRKRKVGVSSFLFEEKKSWCSILHDHSRNTLQRLQPLKTMCSYSFEYYTVRRTNFFQNDLLPSVLRFSNTQPDRQRVNGKHAQYCVFLMRRKMRAMGDIFDRGDYSATQRRNSGLPLSDITLLCVDLDWSETMS